MAGTTIVDTLDTEEQIEEAKNQYQLFNPDSREAGDYCISEY